MTKNIQDVVAKLDIAHREYEETANYAKWQEDATKILTQLVKEVEAGSNARYIADLYKIRSHFNYPDPMLNMGQLNVPTNYTIITTMIAHLCDKYDVTHEQIKQALTTPPTSDVIEK